MELLTRSEELLLLAIWRLQEEAYGIQIGEELTSKTGSIWAIGAIYGPLHRLEKKGYVRSSQGEPKEERGGRRTVIYELTIKGKEALFHAKEVVESLWANIDTTAFKLVRS
ncbi:MAG: helix-turn-helix transcriptional regulator [Bacteroidetes bacterium]|nr:helix-turn-helix transcriptional regulator [Bacteroidota bacterium]